MDAMTEKRAIRRHDSLAQTGDAEHPPGQALLVSVIVLSYNYGRYLRQCIDSVLAQDHQPLEVIVIDDGSTDDSRSIIESYGDRIIGCCKANGGEASSMNVGFSLSHGSIVIFLDSDDYLLPGAISTHVRALSAPGVVRSQVYLTVLEGTQLTRHRLPGVHAAEGDLRALLLERGPGAYVSPPNSGNAWSRAFLNRMFPVPEEPRTNGGETYLMDTAPLFGMSVTAEVEPRAAYRFHGSNTSGVTARMTADNIRTVIAHRAARIAWLEKVATSLGYQPCTADWDATNWRVLTLEYLFGRMSGTGHGPSLTEHLRPAFMSRGHYAKRLLLALLLLCIRVAPLTVSLFIASRIIKLRYM